MGTKAKPACCDPHAIVPRQRRRPCPRRMHEPLETRTGRAPRGYRIGAGQELVRAEMGCILLLGEMGPAAVPVRIELLDDKIGMVGSAAAYSLKRLGPEAKAAIPALRSRLRDEEGERVHIRGRVLGQMGSQEAEHGDCGSHRSAREERGLRHSEVTLISTRPRRFWKWAPRRSRRRSAAPARLLRDQEMFFLADAAKELGKLSSRAKAAVPALTGSALGQERFGSPRRGRGPRADRTGSQGRNPCPCETSPRRGMVGSMGRRAGVGRDGFACHPDAH